MKKLKRLLRVPVSAYKKRVGTLKTSVKDWRKARKQDKRAIAQLEKGLLVLDSSGKSTSRGIDLYKQYRNGTKDGFLHGIQESVKLSLREIAIRLKKDNSQTLKEALYASSVVIRKPARKHPIKRALQMVAVPVASVATFVRKPIKPVWRWLGLALIVFLILWAIVAIFSSSRKTTIKNPSETVSNNLTCATWVMEPMVADDSNNRWFADGIAEISNAKTPEQAKAAFIVWKDKTKSHHNLLVAAGRALLPVDKSNFDESTISNDGDCANDSTVQLVSQIELAVIGQSKPINAVSAPTNGFNTGVENGKVVGSATPGISGDRRAIQITLRDGRKVWIMGRCGNIVTTKDVFKHHGKTDEHHKDHPKKPTPPKLTPKDPSKDVGANPKVAPWKKDNTGGDSSKGHQVSSGDGATVSNGLQTNPAADATAAKDAATKAAATDTATHDSAKQSAVTVDSNQSHTTSTPPPSNW